MYKVKQYVRDQGARFDVVNALPSFVPEVTVQPLQSFLSYDMAFSGHPRPVCCIF